MLILNGIPCISTDINNCLPYGDIINLIEGVPIIHEIKSSKNTF